MQVNLDNIYATVTDAGDEETRWLADLLTFESPRKGRYQPNSIKLYNRFTKTYPAGFTAMLSKAAKASGVIFRVQDTRIKPCEADTSANVDWLKTHPAVQAPITHQLEALEACERRSRGIVAIPTGGGKTEVFAALTKRLPCRWLFLAHRIDLFGQTAARLLARTGENSGLVAGGEWKEERVTLASFQTMHAALKRDPAKALALLQSVGGVVVDECHTTPAASYFEVLSKCNAYYRIGLSGTPLVKQTQVALLAVGALGSIIYRVKATDLVAKGIIARPKIVALRLHQSSNAARWQDVYTEAVAASPVRNKAVTEMVKRAPKPALVFVQAVEHGKALVKLFGKAGVRAAFVYGAKSTEERLAAIRRLSRGDLDALICSVIFQEGVDIPDLRSVVIATGGASPVAAIQRVGRGTRKAAGKAEVYIFDFKDEGHEWLERHSRERLRAYRAEGYDVEEVTKLA